jgi:hypothetical protein
LRGELAALSDCETYLAICLRAAASDDWLLKARPSSICPRVRSTPALLAAPLLLLLLLLAEEEEEAFLAPITSPAGSGTNDRLESADAKQPEWTSCPKAKLPTDLFSPTSRFRERDTLWREMVSSMSSFM